MPCTRARTATLGAPAPRPTVGVAKRHIARIAYHTHRVKSPLNAHLATPARATVDTHTPPTTAHKKKHATLGVPSDKTHTVRVEHLCACIYAWSTPGRARWSFRARVVLCRSRACARGRIARDSKHMDVGF